ncbi:MAG: hypothetical protein PHW22_00805 [Bacilli bacterium]|nr:hypothetical protein [Bacilli bacterium]
MEEENLFDIEQAIKYLEDTYVLRTSYNNHRSYIMKKKDKIVISDGNSLFSLSLKEFERLYHEAKFSLVEDDEEVVDLKKDEEYYSWGKKM